MAPADSPKMVTERGSPPKDAMFSWTQVRVASWSMKAQFPKACLSPVLGARGGMRMLSGPLSASRSPGSWWRSLYVNGCQGNATPAGERLRVGGLGLGSLPLLGFGFENLRKVTHPRKTYRQPSICNFRVVLGSPESTNSRSVQLMRTGLHQGVRTTLGTGVIQ